MFKKPMEIKASDVTRLMVQMYLGQAIWTPKQYDKLAEEGYNQNVWVYRCIQAIAEASAGVDWLVYQKDSKGHLKELEGHAVLDLLDRPNEFMSKKEFIETVVAYLLLSGNSYIEQNGPDNGAPLELWPLRPDRMKVFADAKTFIGGYEYEVNGNKFKFDAKKVIHLKTFNPTNDFYGLSPISIASRGIDTDNAANTWNAALLQNGARPSGAMVTENTLSDPQYEHLKYEIESNYKGAAKAGKFMLLEGGLTWQEMGLSPKDMDFIQSKKLSRLEICAAFGVPPEIVGDKEHATYSNYQEARASFYMETVLPMLDRIKDKFNAVLMPKYGERLFLNYDRDNIEALQESRAEVWDRVLKAESRGLLTINEVRQAVGYEDIKGGDVRQMPVNVIPVGNDAGAYSVNEEIQDDEPGRKKKAFNLVTDEQKTAHWKAIDNRRNGFYKAVTDKVKGQFETERKAVVKAVENGGINAAEKAINKQKDEWQKLLTAIDIMVIDAFGKTTFEQLKHDAMALEVKAPDNPFNVFDEAVQAWIAETVAKKVVLVTDTTKQQIRDRIAEGEAEGESIPELAARIDELYLDQIIPNRSTVIARTEVISSSNAGSRFAAKQTGLDLRKEWIATRDKRTRSTHKHIDGEIRDIEALYSNGLLFPGDPNGTAKEVIQCRCTEAYLVND